MFRRVACGFCALILCVCCCVRPAAAAAASATVAVTGGSIAAGGLSAGGLASVVFPPVAVILGLTLAGAGINTVITDAARESGMTKTEFISSKWDDFSSSIGQTQAATNDAIIRNTEIAADGTIALAGGACDLITQFGDWLFSLDQVVDPDVPGLPGSLSGVNTLFFQQGKKYSYSEPDFQTNTVKRDTYIFCIARGDGTYNIAGVSVGNTQPGSTLFKSGSSSWFSLDLRQQSTADSTIWYGYNVDHGAFSPALPGAMTFPSLESFTSWASALTLDGDSEIPATGDDVYFGGKADVWTENKDLLNPAYDQPVMLNPDYLNGLSDDLAGDYTIGAADYLSALRDAWEALGTDVVTSIPLTAVDTGLVTDFPVANTATANPTISNTAVGDQAFTPAISYDTLADPSQVASSLQVNISEIFPFCIPFDIARVATLLEADPVAPVIRWRFYIPQIVDYTLEVDLSAWEPVAVVLRGGEVLLFVVGLAFVTRSLIRG